MKNVTLSMDEELLKSGREYARRMHMSFNALVRKLVAETVSQKKDGLAEFNRLAENLHGDSGGWRWNRDELYRKRLDRDSD